MLPFKNFLVYKMPARCNSTKFLFYALFVFVFLTTTAAATKPLTPARVLAAQTGATQYEEERYEARTDPKHHIKKRSSDEDVDYEVYQGVVGRPGIDFPIYPRIPRTSFSCKSFGNGYFADMDTDCQVFHICEEGRKISFLCPNGTIFQQQELTCDWWFKVNCLGSPGYYAESAEILSKQRLQRVRPQVPVQGFNIVGGGLNIKPRIAQTTQRARSGGKSDRRIDSNEQPSLENVDFDDLSAEKQLKGAAKGIANIDNNNNDADTESQIAEESASFVGNNRRKFLTYDKTQYVTENKSNEREKGRIGFSSSAATPTVTTARSRNGYRNPPEAQQQKEPNDRTRNGSRGQQRYKEEKKPLAESSEESKLSSKAALPQKTVNSPVPVEGSAKSADTEEVINADNKNFSFEIQKTPTTTPFFPSGTYSTARRLESTRTTPFYTPTVPTIGKSKTTEGKTHYVKNQGPKEVVTTPNPNRINGNGNSGTRVPTNSAETVGTVPTTLKPFVIGMRHNLDSSSEIFRIPVVSNSRLSGDAPVKATTRQFEAPTYLPTSTPASTRATYLPKSAKSPKAPLDAAGDALLFAPSAGADENVSRNVDEMIKTVNFLQTKLTSPKAEQQHAASTREGLEIPPSSGPDVIISLAKYFAAEQNNVNSYAPNALDTSKSARPSSRSTESSLGLPTGSKLSDTTTTLTTEATSVGLSDKADDIQTSLLSAKIVDQYSSLFGQKEAKARNQEADLSKGLLSNANDSKSAEGERGRNQESTSFPQIGTTDTTIRQLAAKPESRKIAQVFSNALSTYLEDPKSFREQLESVRPTEPPGTGAGRSRTSEAPLFNRGTGATYLPTKATTTNAFSKISSTTPASSIVAEINNEFELSTANSSGESQSTTTEQLDTTTYRPSVKDYLKFELSGELAPPNQESGEVDEFLQREQTQSFAKSRNEIAAVGKEGLAGVDSQSQTASPAGATTKHPWQQTGQRSGFLDPLTINDALMKESTTTTLSPFTYLPKVKSTTTTSPLDNIAAGKVQVLSTGAQRLQTTKSSHQLVGSAEVTTPHDSQGRQSSWQDIFSSYDLPRDTLPSSSGLQRIANKLFGGLNESEALHLRNVMLQAEHNRQVLGLLLLLIQACDDQNGKALERSRKHLLNALIDMDSKLVGDKGKTAHEKGSAPSATTTARVPVTTARRQGTDGSISTTTSYTPTTTDAVPTTTVLSTLSPLDASVEATTKFEIRVAEQGSEEDSVGASSSPSGTLGNTSDKRALELLKSLYSLASKFSSSR